MKKLFVILTILTCLFAFTVPGMCWDDGGWGDLKVPYLIKTAAPTVNDDDYPVPFLWTDTTNDLLYILIDNASGAAVWDNIAIIGDVAPKDAAYIVQTANSTLTGEQALSALSTGIVKNTTTTGILSIAVDGTDYLAASRIDDTKGDSDTGYVWSADKVFDELDVRCLESVFGTAIGTGLTLDSTTLKASTILQKYHGVDPAANTLTLLGGANFAAWRQNLDLEAGTDFYSKSAEDTWRDSVTQTEMGYLHGVTSDVQDQFDARCLESVFGTAIGTGLVLDSTTLKASTILQKYHGVDPSANVLTYLGAATFAAMNSATGLGTEDSPTFTAVTTAASATPYVAGVDSNQDDDDTTWKIYGNATATGTGAEVADMYFQAQGAQGTAGTLQTFLWWDGSSKSFALQAGSVFVPEITTPTAIENFGSFYTKTDNKPYFQSGAGGEYEISAASTYYAEMYLNANSTATTISTASKPIALQLFTTGLVSGWTFDAGSEGPIASFATGTGGASFTRVNDEGHGLEDGDIITITGSTVAGQNGVFTVSSKATDYFDINFAWDSDGGAGAEWNQGSHLIAGTGAAGKYAVSFHTCTTVAAADTLTLQVYINTTACTKCIGQRKMPNNDQGNLVGHSILTIADGDEVYLVITSTGTTDITSQYGNLSMHRL